MAYLDTSTPERQATLSRALPRPAPRPPLRPAPPRGGSSHHAELSYRAFPAISIFMWFISLTVSCRISWYCLHTVATPLLSSSTISRPGTPAPAAPTRSRSTSCLASRSSWLTRCSSASYPAPVSRTSASFALRATARVFTFSLTPHRHVSNLPWPGCLCATPSSYSWCLSAASASKINQRQI